MNTIKPKNDGKLDKIEFEDALAVVLAGATMDPEKRKTLAVVVNAGLMSYSLQNLLMTTSSVSYDDLRDYLATLRPRVGWEDSINFENFAKTVLELKQLANEVWKLRKGDFSECIYQIE